MTKLLTHMEKTTLSARPHDSRHLRRHHGGGHHRRHHRPANVEWHRGHDSLDVAWSDFSNLGNTLIGKWCDREIKQKPKTRSVQTRLLRQKSRTLLRIPGHVQAPDTCKQWFEWLNLRWRFQSTSSSSYDKEPHNYSSFEDKWEAESPCVLHAKRDPCLCGRLCWSLTNI